MEQTIEEIIVDSAPTDKIGQDLAEGDFIAYGHALGRCAGLRIGKILHIKYVGKGCAGWSEWKIGVIGIDDDYSKYKPTLAASKGTLGFPNRLLRLRREDVPFNYLLLLDPITKDVKIPKMAWEDRRQKREKI